MITFTSIPYGLIGTILVEGMILMMIAEYIAEKFEKHS